MTLLRSAAFNAWLVLVTVVVGLAGLPIRWFAPERALDLAKLWARLLLGGARLLCGIEVQATGLGNIPPGAALIASQHQSALDTLIWMNLVPLPSYVFKAELRRIPLIGPLLVPAGQIPLDRSASFAAVRNLLRLADQAKAAGRQIIIFPEGTRVEPGERVVLRPGFALLASRTGLPVIPVATDSGRVWGRRAFTKQAGTVRVMVGRPLPQGLGQAELLETVQRCWDDMHAAVDKFVE